MKQSHSCICIIACITSFQCHANHMFVDEEFVVDEENVQKW